ncbi:MAG: bifunctional DNA primase/polymerase [Acidobacteriia bacterium]|nr:bifunctional DNA primase/polymerase [Terriglobia bacterium]
MNETLEAALNYIQHGLSPFPLKPSTKYPNVRHWKPYRDTTASLRKCNEWWGNGSNNDIAIVTQGLLVLDPDGEEGMKSVHGLYIPETPTVITGDGLHHYFKDPGFDVKNCQHIIPSVDIRAYDGYAKAPPSKHESGELYRWKPGYSLDDIPLAYAPLWLIELIRISQKHEIYTNHSCPN